MSPDRIYLSPPHMSDVERELLLDAFDSNWIAPVGPDLPEFEQALGQWCDRPNAVALSSGTAALHLALLLVGTQPGDQVLVPSFTFVATANAVIHAGATPVFIDSSEADWNMDPALLSEVMDRRAKLGGMPRAVLPVDLYGQCADYAAIEDICADYDVPVIADAAEALGARRDNSAAGSHGVMAALSFNGNKIITTGGGGALLADDPKLIDRARYLATQARLDAPHYQHEDVGFNYRMSNLLAAVGRGQLRRLANMMERRAQIHARYVAELGGLAGVDFMPVPPGSEPNRWLTVITIDPSQAKTDREALRLVLEAQNIEARPAWKPLHMQPLFANAEVVGGAVCERVFQDGLCLPTGSAMSNADLDRVVELLVSQLT